MIIMMIMIIILMIIGRLAKWCHPKSPASKRGQDKRGFCRSAAIYHSDDMIMALLWRYYGNAWHFIRQKNTTFVLTLVFMGIYGTSIF